MKYFLFVLFLKYTFSNICNTNEDCSSCKNCSENNQDLCSCSFHNAFCFNQTNNSYTFDSSFLLRYDKNQCYSNSYSFYSEDICGKSDISKNVNTDNYYTFFTFNNSDYLNNNNLLCHYLFTNKNSKEDLLIDIEFKLDIENNQNKGNNRNLIFFVIRYFNSNEKETDPKYVFNLNEFINDKISVKITEYKYISLYVSLLQNNELFENEISYLKLRVKKDNTKEKNLKKYKYALVTVCLICIFCLVSCFILYLIKYKKNRELLRLRAMRMADGLHDLENAVDPIDKKNKLENLFKNKLKKKKYLKKYNINETTACSICLEEFIENISVVCITPCLHIFHYDCLHNWLFMENSNCQCPYCNYDLLSDKPPTKRHINHTPKGKNISEKMENKNENNRGPNKENKYNFNTSERFIKKVKGNKNGRFNTDNTNILGSKSTEQKNENNNNNINNEIEINIENSVENNKEINNENNKAPNIGNEDNENDISFEKDFNKIKNRIKKNEIKNSLENNNRENEDNNINNDKKEDNIENKNI